MGSTTVETEIITYGSSNVYHPFGVYALFISNSGLLKNISCVIEINAMLVQGPKISVIG